MVRKRIREELSFYYRNFFSDSAGTAKLMVIEGLGLLVSLWQLLFKWFCECVAPSDNQFGSLREIERLESAWGLKSPAPPPITSFADTSNPVTFPPVSPWRSEQTPENTWGETSTAPKEKRLTRVEQSLLHLEPMRRTLKSILRTGLLRCDSWVAVY